MPKLHGKNKTNISRLIDENIAIVEERFGKSVDLTKREFEFQDNKKIRAVCFFLDGLVNSNEINAVIKSLMYKAELILDEPGSVSIVDAIKSSVLINKSIKVTDLIDPMIDAILAGDTVFFIDGSDACLLVSSREWASRSVEEPQVEQVVRGPRDGFTESIRTNTALVRRRIRDPNLMFEAMTVGKKSKTDINIAYLQETVKEGLVEEVKKRISRIKIDAILESSYIEELIEDAPFSPFTTVQSTERPDKVASSLLEGRVAIFVDNTPFVLVVPTYFWQFMQASDDYYSRFLAGSFNRVIRYVAFIISLTLPSMYVMLVSFHQEMIPTSLALTIASGRDVNPFPVLIEALIMEIAFELMREAGVRMPKPVGQAVSIVGSLVIGQAAVQAGVVSPFMVIIVALTGISSFAIPNYAASFSIRLIRFVLLIASGTMGLLGFATAFAFLAIHAMSLRSFGESYLAPATPFKPSDQKDFIFRAPLWTMDEQPDLAEGKENRLAEDQLPKPNKKESKSKESRQTFGNGLVKIRRKASKSRRHDQDEE
ncbi:spore germination protein [Robertmurraya massiliosenegalensis]|uniref:spore germination protein n=1 Tax=Robertmurraya massiliosenegalensis TaxID=1287657 RepID=UPI0002DE9768|nr:spore germination protein [Robertmurraya massiliosenegalensis]